MSDTPVPGAYGIRIGGLWMAVQCDTPEAALLAAAKEYGYAIDAALNGQESVVKASESNKRVTISIVKL